MRFNGKRVRLFPVGDPGEALAWLPRFVQASATLPLFGVRSFDFGGARGRVRHLRDFYDVEIEAGLLRYEFFATEFVLNRQYLTPGLYPGDVADITNIRVAGSGVRMELGRNGLKVSPVFHHPQAPGGNGSEEVPVPRNEFQTFHAWNNQRFYEYTHWPENNPRLGVVTSTGGHAAGMLSALCTRSRFSLGYWDADDRLEKIYPNNNLEPLTAEQVLRMPMRRELFRQDRYWDVPTARYVNVPNKPGPARVPASGLPIDSPPRWWRHSAMRKVSHPTHGSRWFVITTDFLGRFYAYPVSGLGAVEAAPGTPGYTPMTEHVVEVDPPVPEWFDTEINVDEQGFDEHYNSWVWEFNKGATKAVTVHHQSLLHSGRVDNEAYSTEQTFLASAYTGLVGDAARTDAGRVGGWWTCKGIPLEPYDGPGDDNVLSAMISAFAVRGVTEFATVRMAECVPGLVELNLLLELVGPAPEDFTFSITLSKNWLSSDTGRVYLSAGYALKSERLRDLGVDEDDLVTLEVDTRFSAIPDEVLFASPGEDTVSAVFHDGPNGAADSPRMEISLAETTNRLEYEFSFWAKDAKVLSLGICRAGANFRPVYSEQAPETGEPRYGFVAGWFDSVSDSGGDRGLEDVPPTESVCILRALDVRTLSVAVHYEWVYAHGGDGVNTGNDGNGGGKYHTVTLPETQQVAHVARILGGYVARCYVHGRLEQEKAVGEIGVSGVFSLPPMPAKLSWLSAAVGVAFLRLALHRSFAVHPEGHVAYCENTVVYDSDFNLLPDLSLDLIMSGKKKPDGSYPKWTHREMFNRAFSQSRDYAYYVSNPNAMAGSFRSFGVFFS